MYNCCQNTSCQNTSNTTGCGLVSQIFNGLFGGGCSNRCGTVSIPVYGTLNIPASAISSNTNGTSTQNGGGCSRNCCNPCRCHCCGSATTWNQSGCTQARRGCGQSVAASIVAGDTDDDDTVINRYGYYPYGYYPYGGGCCCGR